MRFDPELAWWLLALCLILLSFVSAENCSLQEFTCATGSCMPKDCECDFTDNCGDGSDETNCSTYKRCDFEKDFCDIIFSSETSDWTRTTSVPGLNHGHSKTSAHFLSLLPEKGGILTADLKSPVFLASQSCQMRLFYYVKAELGNLQVLLQTVPLGENRLVWADNMQKPQTGVWQKAVVQFFTNDNFKVIIRGKLEGESEILAIDDISFTPECQTVPSNASVSALSLHTWENRLPLVNICLPTQFSCDDGQCIEESKVCDFIPDCLHGEDEASCCKTY